MNRFEAIKERYERYTDLNTNTDEKLENGAISDWTFHGDDDMGWLLERHVDLLEACDAGLNALENILSSEFATHRNPEPEDSDPAVIQLRTVIARAKGEKMKAKPIDIDALVAEAVPPGPNPQLAFTMPVRVDSETNPREAWQKKWARKKKQQDALHKAWTKANLGLCSCVLSLPCVVRLIRVGSRKLDSDNLAEAFKAIRDAVASQFGLDDGDERITWEYEQVAVGKRVYAVRVEIY